MSNRDDVRPASRKRSPLKGKGGLVMIPILALLGGFIWYDRLHGRPEEPGAGAMAYRFIGVRRPESVTRIEVRGTPTPYTLVKRGESWRLAAPYAAPAAKQAVEDAIKS